jgi:AAHS family 4-hydroxybenzoate transporter-like MFS transporter
MIPFMGIHALETTGNPESFLGPLLSVQMAGMIAGNLLAGWMGDRWGGKAALMAGHVLLLILCLAFPFGQSPQSFVALFALFGFGISFNNVGGPTLDMEIAPASRRVSAMAVIGWANLAGILGASLAAGWLRDHGYSFSLLAVLAGAGVAVATLLLWRIKEPRTCRSAGA